MPARVARVGGSYLEQWLGHWDMNGDEELGVARIRQGVAWGELGLRCTLLSSVGLQPVLARACAGSTA